MSLQRRHQMMGAPSQGFYPIALVRSMVTGISSTDPAVITQSAATNGNLIVLVIGGVQSRLVNSISGGGWSTPVVAVGAPGTMIFSYKIASGEPGSYSIDLTGTLVPGAVYYYEFSGIDPVNPYVGYVNGGSFIPNTGITLPAYSVVAPGVVVSGLQTPSGVSPQWQAGGGFTNYVVSAPSRAAHKIYGKTETGVTLNWTGGTANESLGMAAIFKAKNLAA